MTFKVLRGAGRSRPGGDPGRFADLRSLCASPHRVFRWSQPDPWAAAYELRAETALVAALRWERTPRRQAVAEAAGGCWVLRPGGLLLPRTVISGPTGEGKLGVVVPRRDAGATLTLTGGRAFRWRRAPLWRTAWVWQGDGDVVLLSLKDEQMTLDPAGAAVEEVPLLALLAWYLHVLRARTDGGA